MGSEMCIRDRFNAVCAIAGVRQGHIITLDTNHSIHMDDGVVRAEALVEIDGVEYLGSIRGEDVANAAVGAFVAAVNQALTQKSTKVA